MSNIESCLFQTGCPQSFEMKLLGTIELWECLVQNLRLKAGSHHAG